MGLTDKQKFILFVLGKLYDQANKNLEQKLLQISISKSAFIEIVRRSGLTEKGERALYRNLEDLEKSRYISYENKILKLSSKGGKEYIKISRAFTPYQNIIKVIESENLVRLTKKAKTTFIFD